MPNRIIKESICTSDNLDQLSWQEEVFFYRLIVSCDDYGRLDARPAILRARCFPLRLLQVTEKQTALWLQSLAQHHLVQVYEVDGQRYLQVCTWEKHQQIRAKRSKFPAPDSNGNHLIADDSICTRNPIQSESNPNPNPIAQGFESFWKAYPKKRSKGQAEKAFLKVNPDEQLLALMLSAIERATKSGDWRKDDGRFIPHPATWLNAKGWEDEIKEGNGRLLPSSSRNPVDGVIVEE